MCFKSPFSKKVIYSSPFQYDRLALKSLSASRCCILAVTNKIVVQMKYVCWSFEPELYDLQKTDLLVPKVLFNCMNGSAAVQNKTASQKCGPILHKAGAGSREHLVMHGD
jgi:hypothetical protein